ncbi:ribonuclease-domain-containing protein [Delitschia confertaspora ATCC 74209]|uniref:ribonuclease T1 n=1 Tax=Delitschia confertaspora ATCC 74209 TaxID=1513339 RepID=A0A9P4JJP7_9PLEO|nr:ribonuclease-domain-containing protein [Delitschia confertaspora ATCC 74209]
MQFIPLILLSLLSLTSALPTGISPSSLLPENLSLIPRACATTCGSNCYTSAQISSALSAGCNYVTQGSTAGSSTYPHVYNNYEGFGFSVSGPYYEFPILRSGVYSGGSPGADRIIFNKSCKIAGEITHTGASGNNFVGCTGTS